MPGVGQQWQPMIGEQMQFAACLMTGKPALPTSSTGPGASTQGVFLCEASSGPGDSRKDDGCVGILADRVCQLTARQSFSPDRRLCLHTVEDTQMNAKVTENTQQHRFELPIADGAIAAAYYRLENGRLVMIHTEVPTEFCGQGIASQLAHGIFELLRKTGRKAIPKCPFMGQFLVKNPQYSDVLAR